MLLHHLEHNRVLHEQVVLLTVITSAEPRVPATERLEIIKLREGMTQLIAKYGFMQSPNVPVVLRQCEHYGLHVSLETTTFYIGRETVIPTTKVVGMAIWREKLYAFLARNALDATAFYNIPPDRVVEVGIQVEI